MTETLTGRELDLAVAEAMGWKHYGEKDRRCLPPGGEWQDDVSFTEHGSGLAAVLDWLTANAPTREQAEAIMGPFEEPVRGPWLDFHLGNGPWIARWYVEEDGQNEQWTCELTGKAPTLPEAAAKLLLAWVKVRKERGWA